MVVEVIIKESLDISSSLTIKKGWRTMFGPVFRHVSPRSSEQCVIGRLSEMNQKIDIEACGDGPLRIAPLLR